MHRHRLPFVATLALSSLAGCSLLPNPAAPPTEPEKFIGSFNQIDEFTVAEEVVPQCALEELAADKLPEKDEGWKPSSIHKRAGERLTILKRAAVLNARGEDPAFYRALLVQGKSGEPTWIRNAPVKAVGDIDAKWRCAVPWKDFEEATAKYVRSAYQLALGAPGCQGAMPIVGGEDDVTFTPYTVKKKRPILDASGQLVFGITLVADGGEKQLTVPSTDLGRCFVVANRPPPPRDETKALLEWIRSPSPEDRPPPAVSFDTLQMVAGVDPKSCTKDGSGPTEHYACSAPVVVVRALPPAEGGEPRLFFARERVADTLHVYGGKLVAADDAIAVDAVVRLPKLPQNGSMARALASSIADSSSDPDKRLARASHGYRLLRVSDGMNAQVATNYVNVDLTYAIPEVETTEEQRTHHFVAGQKSVVNPEYTKAKKELAEATAELDDAESDAKDAAADASSKGCAQAKGVLAVVCDAGNKGMSGVAKARVALAKQRVADAKKALRGATKSVRVDDIRDYAWNAKVLHRRGEALAQVTITAGDGGATLAQATIHVPFDANDAELPSDPEHGMSARAAKPPTIEDAEKAIGEALVSEIDKMMTRWTTAQETDAADVATAKPGTRRWAAAVARRAASGHAVRLVDDALETRQEKLFANASTIRVRLPSGSSERCYTFTATPADGRGDANLTLDLPKKRRPPGAPPIARDVRVAPDAGFEVCGLETGSYTLALSSGGIVSARGVLVSMFESTPGRVNDTDLRASAEGVPNTVSGDDAIAFNKDTAARARNDAAAKPGDKDGDGVPDDKDACPMDPETVNGYLDEDGCPDEVPPGYTPAEKKK